MPRNCTKFGNDFRQKFNYTGKLTKECMGDKLWNEYYKMLMKERFSSSYHKLEQIFTANELMKMNIYYNCKPGELIFIRINEHNNNTKLHYGCRIRDKSRCGRCKKI